MSIVSELRVLCHSDSVMSHDATAVEALLMAVAISVRQGGGQMIKVEGQQVDRGAEGVKFGEGVLPSSMGRGLCDPIDKWRPVVLR